MDFFTTSPSVLFERTFTQTEFIQSRTQTSFVERQTRTLNTLKAHLSSRTFFVGERITLADIFVANVIQKSVGVTIDTPLCAKLPNFIRHLETIVNQPKLEEIFCETEYMEKAIQFVPPAK